MPASQFNYQIIVTGQIQANSEEQLRSYLASAFTVPLRLIESIGRIEIGVVPVSPIVAVSSNFNPKRP